MPPIKSFELGQVVATPGALQALAESGESALDLIRRHADGDWGDVDNHDKQMNDESLVLGGRLLSAYKLRSGERLYVITEAEAMAGVREVTTILKPSEY